MTLILSWIESANDPKGHFPINNLPYGVFSIDGSERRCCVAVGDELLDLSALEAAGKISVGEKKIFCQPSLNKFMALGAPKWKQLREQLVTLLSEVGSEDLRGDSTLIKKAFFKRTDVEMHLPFEVSEFTDFYANKHHATNVGTMFRGTQNALPPNWLHIPLGYNGRASTVVVSGAEISRPMGQLKSLDQETPHFAVSEKLDFELEMGAVVGLPTEMGSRQSVTEADDLIFGYVLLNDWSARDIQAWEYQPLGPFQAKAFATTISPWVVTKEALEQFRTATPKRENPLLPYLSEKKPGLYDIDLTVTLQPKNASTASKICQTNYREMYYSAAQQLAHHTSGGCKMNTGDLLGSGTISGPEKSARGSLLELSWGGEEPITLDTGEQRSFLEDGDIVTFAGQAIGDGFTIGFGDCVGQIKPAIPYEE